MIPFQLAQFVRLGYPGYITTLLDKLDIPCRTNCITSSTRIQDVRIRLYHQHPEFLWMKFASLMSRWSSGYLLDYEPRGSGSIPDVSKLEICILWIPSQQRAALCNTLQHAVRTHPQDSLKSFTTHGFTKHFMTSSPTLQPSRHTCTICPAPGNPIGPVPTLPPFAKDKDNRTFSFPLFFQFSLEAEPSAVVPGQGEGKPELDTHDENCTAGR